MLYSLLYNKKNILYNSYIRLNPLYNVKNENLPCSSPNGDDNNFLLNQLSLLVKSIVWCSFRMWNLPKNIKPSAPMEHRNTTLCCITFPKCAFSFTVSPYQFYSQ